MLNLETVQVYSVEEPGVKTMICAKFDTQAVVERAMYGEIIGRVAQLIAERYVADNYQEIIKHITPEAVATLTAAETAAKIRESLEKNIPSRVLEIEKTRTEVWQRGVLGGMSRIR
jgi:hypothetical protein